MVASHRHAALAPQFSLEAGLQRNCEGSRSRTQAVESKLGDMGAEDLNVAEVAEVAEVAVANGMNNETDEVFGTGFVIFMISRIWNLSD